MNHALNQLAEQAGLARTENRALRLAFGLACARRVRHLLEDPRATACLDVLAAYVAGDADEAALARAVEEGAAVARGHRGSGSIDGTAHAAVSATYSVANALAGRALEAASYAAYATVYAYGGYAISDPDSFAPEFAWQVQCLREMAPQAAIA
ncbi:MAG: hypothetical protein JWN73_1503 [Betaproteobacteria bacterium]|nr:hypothetical protein [Betaproteobacteria bacterium]